MRVAGRTVRGETKSLAPNSTTPTGSSGDSELSDESGESGESDASDSSDDWPNKSSVRFSVAFGAGGTSTLVGRGPEQKSPRHHEPFRPFWIERLG